MTAYMGGFLLCKFQFHHIKKTNVPVNHCNSCKSLLSEDIDFTLHLYNTFKEYESQNQKKLQYCSGDFVLHILQWETVFQHVFKHFRNIPNIRKLMRESIAEHTTLPEICKMEFAHFLIDLFLRTRLYHSIKSLNLEMHRKDATDKIKKIKGF